MRQELTSFQFETVRHVASERIGMAVSERNRKVVEIRVARAAASLNLPVSRFCLMLGHDASCVSALIRELTVHETYFMREKPQLAFAARWLHQHIRDRESDTLQVLSAGCASGEEVYSLRMTMMETVPAVSDVVHILGIDISPNMIAKAEAGRYQPHALRMLSLSQVERFFETDQESAFVLREGVRRHSRFQADNLLSVHLPAASYDMILCRNLLMYLTEEARDTLVKHFVRWLRPGGSLLLGTTEAIRTGKPELQKEKDGGVFYYVRKEGSIP